MLWSVRCSYRILIRGYVRLSGNGREEIAWDRQTYSCDSQGIVSKNRCCFIFFFQAEDGIRDLTVTGVQTCALPIFAAAEAKKKITIQAMVWPVADKAPMAKR